MRLPCKIYALFPKIKELLRIENLCRYLGFDEKLKRDILRMKPVAFRGKLYSSEYKRHFETERSVAEIKHEPNELDKLRLTIDGVSDTNWFRQKHKEFLQKIEINPVVKRLFKNYSEPCVSIHCISQSKSPQGLLRG